MERKKKAPRAGALQKLPTDELVQRLQGLLSVLDVLLHDAKNYAFSRRWAPFGQVYNAIVANARDLDQLVQELFRRTREG